MSEIVFETTSGKTYSCSIKEDKLKQGLNALIHFINTYPNSFTNIEEWFDMSGDIKLLFLKGESIASITVYEEKRRSAINE